MLEFIKLEQNVLKIKDYLNLTDGKICDLSVGVRYMWRDEYVNEYAVYNDTLILKETGPDYQEVFYFPIGNDIDGALTKIEEFARSKNITLSFGCLTEEQANLIKNRYSFVDVSFERDWCDYIYEAEKFKTYSGKRLSGQRNHVNKFKKLYPDYKFKIATNNDLERIKEFFVEFKKSRTLSDEESSELCEAIDLTENMFELDQLGGYLKVDGKIVAFSIGEVVGQTLIVHVEKGLTCYEGVYPTMAKEFASAFAVDGVKFINREEDCGDTGLRTSKMQYRPLELANKNYAVINTLFDKISAPVCIKTERITICDIDESDKNAYQKLYLDDDINKWWGYDYREDLNGNEPNADYFLNFQIQLKRDKEEFDFAIKKDGELIGELALHDFDYFGGVEIGFRFFKEYQGKGFAFESATALIKYCKNTLGAKRIKAKCLKENLPSKKLIERLGFGKANEDQKYFYFELNF